MDRHIEFKGIMVEEDTLVRSSTGMIEFLLGEPDSKKPDEWVYVLEQYCFGLFKKKLHLFFSKEEVTDYYIGI
ncbi:MAG: hypothetical protein K0R77_2095 [Chryseobacterium sp.]|jgi:hypothetical protein|uniref:hypothetical protein n=1 Tax=Chryseobacterium sp. TaxID=1871047 RepID=UPI002603C956|nr:hypothetical protein [Chryseobacterium sp.]MDF2552820.1 hypothetical protein [Chryseobacterium sp.]